MTLEKPGGDNRASRIGFFMELPSEKRDELLRGIANICAGHYCTPIYSYPKKNGAASRSWNKERRMRKDRKIHNTFVTNYVLPRLRSLGLRCVASMKMFRRQTRSYVFSRAYFLFGSWRRLEQEEGGNASIFLHRFPLRRDRKNEKVRQKKTIATRSAFLRGFRVYTWNYRAQICVVSWWELRR